VRDDRNRSSSRGNRLGIGVLVHRLGSGFLSNGRVVCWARIRVVVVEAEGGSLTCQVMLVVFLERCCCLVDDVTEDAFADCIALARRSDLLLLSGWRHGEDDSAEAGGEWSGCICKGVEEVKEKKYYSCE
jgi:hypothetical protein